MPKFYFGSEDCFSYRRQVVMQLFYQVGSALFTCTDVNGSESTLDETRLVELSTGHSLPYLPSNFTQGSSAQAPLKPY